MARFRIFVWSVFLGIAIGSVMCVLEPEQSKRVSLTTRTWIKSGVAHARVAIADWQAP